MSTIALVGNPNVGKSLLFNQLTGSDQHVSNFPGTTLSYTKGTIKANGIERTIADLPGTYGFLSNIIEETITFQFLRDQDVNTIINVVDGTKLERNLQLTLQLLELGKPMIVVLTFADLVEKQGIDIDTTQLTELLGCPVISVNNHSITQVQQVSDLLFSDNPMKHNPQLVDMGKYTSLITEGEHLFSGTVLLEDTSFTFPKRWMILHMIMSGMTKSQFWPNWMLDHVEVYVRSKVNGTEYKNMTLNLVKYFHHGAKAIAAKVQSAQPPRSTVSRVDDVLLHPVFGLVFFGIVMYAMFSITYTASQPVTDFLEHLLEILGNGISSVVTNDFLSSFLVDAVVEGVGFVLVFLPQIFFLFIALAILEASGYLGRVIFVTDSYLSKIGITGSSLAPLLLGFGCNIPGILAARGIRDQNERIVVTLVNPFMTCSARLPVYIIIANAIFPTQVGLILFIMYFSSIFIAVIVMFILRRTAFKGTSTALFMELTPLMRPNSRAVLRYAVIHVRSFVQSAGSWMALGIFLIWLLSITGPSGYLGSEAINGEGFETSWIFLLGEFLSPIFGPMGWNNELVVALVLGFIAKEIVIGSLAIIYGASELSLQEQLAGEFTPVTAFAFLIFVLTYTPCIGAYFAIRKELGLKWSNLSVILNFSVAYILALLIVLVGPIIA